MTLDSKYRGNAKIFLIFIYVVVLTILEKLYS